MISRSFDMIDMALSLLNDMDPDPDLEEEQDCCPAGDDQPRASYGAGGDWGPGTPEEAETSIGWPEAPGRMANRLDQSMIHLGDNHSDREHDTADAEPDDEAEEEPREAREAPLTLAPDTRPARCGRAAA